MAIKRTSKTAHNHSLEYMDQRALSDGLKAVIESLHSSIGKPADILNYLHVSPVFRAAGLEGATTTRVQGLLYNRFARPHPHRTKLVNKASTCTDIERRTIANPKVPAETHDERCNEHSNRDQAISPGSLDTTRATPASS